MDRDLETPEAVVAAAVRALEEKRWTDVLPLIDADELSRFRESQLAGLRHVMERTPRTVEQVMESEPYLPREVAEYYAREEAIGLERGRPWMLREWNAEGIAELEALPADQLLLRWLAASDPDAKLRHAWAVSHTPVDDPAAMVPEDSPQMRRVVLGSVLEGDAAHVLYREVWGDDYAERSSPQGNIRVTTVHRGSDGWRLPIDHSLLANAHHGMRVWRSEPDGEPST